MSFVTLKDFADRFGANGQKQYQQIIEQQTKTNKILQVLPYHECNDGQRDMATIRAALPEVAWRMINRGTKPVKTQVKQASFTCGELEGFADVDEKLLKQNNNSNEWRLSENAGIQESMNQKMATTFFYGDEKVNPAGFTGLSAYFYSKTNQESIYADQIIDCGGTGDALTSLWIVGFGPLSCYGIFPKGSHAGFTYEDMGRVELKDANGGIFYGYRSKYNWAAGLVVRDPRFIVRLANIDTTKLSANDADAFIEKMIRGYNQIENPDSVSLNIFCNRDVQTYLDILAAKKTNVRLGIDEFAGKKITHFYGVPILRSDAIVNKESAIV
ncbi:MAG: hypothetical protein IJ056_09490 [Acidaminococcaceae bacterium]|nr:hypothetical protein [Acidaminococcaceae bacterium]